MSLLTRTGTLVRKHRGPGSFSARSSLRRQQSFSAKRPKTQERSLSVRRTQQETEFNNGSEDGTRKHAVVVGSVEPGRVCESAYAVLQLCYVRFVRIKYYRMINFSDKDFR